MPNSSDLSGSVNSGGSEFLWGAQEIAVELGRTERAVHHLLTTGQIQCAVKKGGRWVCSRAKLRAEFGG